jgi:hypothetical protein
MWLLHSAGTRLEPCHYGILCEKFRSCAFKWKEIAQSLQFKYPEIEEIATHRSGQPSSCLSDVIGKWLEWAPGDNRGSSEYATREQLLVAVEKAGFGRLASEVTLDPGMSVYLSVCMSACQKLSYRCWYCHQIGDLRVWAHSTHAL